MAILCRRLHELLYSCYVLLRAATCRVTHLNTQTDKMEIKWAAPGEVVHCSLARHLTATNTVYVDSEVCFCAA